MNDGLNMSNNENNVDSKTNSTPDKPSGRSRFIRRVWRFIIVLVVVFFLSILIIAYTPVGKWMADSLGKTVDIEELRPAEAIVVLGGGPIRAYTAAELYHRQLAPKVLISADHGRLLPVLLRCGVPREKIEFEEISRVTADHPRNIQTFPGITSQSRLILVTSRLHPARVRMIFQRSGFDHVQVFSMDSQWQPLFKDQPTIGLVGWAYLMHELGGTVKDYVRTSFSETKK